MTSVNSFNGGMGNDEYLLGEGQYVYSENLDIYRDPRCIQLAVKPVSVVEDVEDLPIQILSTDNGGTQVLGENRYTILCLENKDIVDGEGDMRYEGSTLRPVSTKYRWTNAYFGYDNLCYFMDYSSGIVVPSNVYTPAVVSNWNINTGDKVWTPYAWDLSGNQLLSNGLTKPVIRIGNADFFSDALDIRNIIMTDFNGGMEGSGAFGPGYPTLTPYAQGISQPGENVYMSVHSDSVWSISRYISVATSSEISALSLVSGETNGGVKQLQINKNTKYLHGVNKSGTDILVAGDELSRSENLNGIPTSVEYSSVYVYIIYGFGADAQQLITKSRHYPNIETAFSNHGVTHYLVGIFGNTSYNWAHTNEMVYCVSNKDNVGLIYAYGKTIAGMPDAWSVIVSKNSAGKSMRRVGCLYRIPTKNGFYFSYEDEDGEFGVDYYDDISIEEPTSYQASGKIYLRNDDSGDMSLKKEIKEIQLGVYVPEDTSIVLSYILDNNGTEVVYDTITHTTQGTESYKKYRGNKPITGYKCIAWFAELQTTGTSTPKIYNFNYEPAAIQV